VTPIVAPGSQLHSHACGGNVLMVSSLAKRSSNAVAPSISMSGVGLFSALCIGFPSGSTGICDVELIIGVLPTMSGSHTLVLSSSRHGYHCTIIPDLRATPWPLRSLNEVNRPVARSISALRVLTYGNPSTTLHALIETTGTCGSGTGAQWFIYFTVSAVL